MSRGVRDQNRTGTEAANPAGSPARFRSRTPRDMSSSENGYYSNEITNHHTCIRVQEVVTVLMRTTRGNFCDCQWVQDFCEGSLEKSLLFFVR
eukprot:gene24783-biopygen10226